MSVIKLAYALPMRIEWWHAERTMRKQIAPRLKKALLASMSILALSLTCSPLLADNEKNDGKNVDGDDFWGQSLIDSSWEGATAVGTNFFDTNLTRANFTNANLTDAIFGGSFGFANLTDAVLEGAIIQGAYLECIVGNDPKANPDHTVTHDMLKSTKSWKDNDLSGVSFEDGDLSGLNFTSFNLSGARFSDANLSGAVLTNANIQGANFGYIVGNAPNTNPDHTVTHEMLMSTKSWQVDKDFSGITFAGADLSGFDFSGMNLQLVIFKYSNLTNAQFSGADLRGANNLTGPAIGPATGFNANDHKNLIYRDGEILNLTLSSADDALTIRGGTDINAFLDGTTATISDKATLTLTQNAVLELTNNTQLTLAKNGHLNLVFDTTDPSSLTSIVIEAGSSLTLDPSAILDITINDLSVAGFEVNILSWEDDADVADLLTRLEDGSAYRINGYTLGELGLYAVVDHDNNTFSIIPEPSNATLSFLALAGLLARRRRKAA